MPLGDAKVRLEKATLRIRNNRISGLACDDEAILRECGYRDANEYWHVATSRGTKVSAFVALLESHLLDPQGVSDRVIWRTMPISALINAALSEAWADGEGWFIAAKGASDDFTKARLRPREAAMWLLRNPLYEDRVPATLRAYLENEQPARPASTHPKVAAPNDRMQARRGGRTRERRDQVMQILRTMFPPDGQPPGGRFPKTLINQINGKLAAQNFGSVGKDTCTRALADLKSEGRAERN